MKTPRTLLSAFLILVALGGVLAVARGLRPGPDATPVQGFAPSSEEDRYGPPAVAADDEDARLDALELRVEEASRRARESTLALEYAAADAPAATRRVATGVVIDDRGDVLSVRIDPPPADAPVVARDASGRRRAISWVAADPETGLTLLRIDAPDLPPVRPSEGPPRLGSQVLVIGNPFGLGHSVRRGQVAGLDRRLELGARPLGGLAQIDVALHPGDSGALVANLKGEWLGLIRSGLTTSDSRRGRDHDLGFAISARDALWVAEQLRAHGRVDRAFLGVQIDPTVTDGPPGAVLGGVLADTPAARAGLRPGDRVVALDGVPIRSPLALTDRLDRTLANAEVTIESIRGPRRDALVLKTTSRPAPAPPPTSTSQPTPPATPPPAPRPDDLRLNLPREVLDRIDRLERRLEELEKRAQPAPSAK